MNIIKSPSKNFYGRNGYKPEIIVVHCTDGYYSSDLEWLRGLDPRSQVSSNYYIAPNGDIHCLVDDGNAAWHAGVVSEPKARIVAERPGVNPNYYSIGIEVSLKPPQPMTVEQEKSLKELIMYLSVSYAILIDRDHIVAHSEIRHTKTCPKPIMVDALVASLMPSPRNDSVDREALKKQIIELIQKL